jgi:hypothetical protein
MKRSKIFLSMATGILAVAALAATKAHKFTTRVVGYYSISSNGPCTVSSGALYYTAQASSAKQATINLHKLFSYNQSGCTKALFTKKASD